MIRSVAQVGRSEGRTRRLATAALLVITLASLSGVASASTVDPSASWWIWAAGLRKGDPTCGVTGQGSLFFVSELAATQTCKVANGQTVLAAVINAEWSATEAKSAPSAFPAFCKQTAQSALLACANWQISHVTAKSATLDGKPTPISKLTSAAFNERWANNNYFGVKPGSTPAAAAGYYALLPPLTPGGHTLHVEGTAVFPPSQGGTFTAATTATLNQQ